MLSNKPQGKLNKKIKGNLAEKDGEKMSGAHEVE